MHDYCQDSKVDPAEKTIRWHFTIDTLNVCVCLISFVDFVHLVFFFIVLL